MHAIHIRRLEPSDSFDALTSMLHRAFAKLGRMGLNCGCVDQSAETTAYRARLGECLVAVGEGRIVGTLTLHRHEPGSECRWYRQSDGASLHQFAVDPSFQGRGCGQALLRAAERWAREHGCRELALDTPAPAEHLIRFYRSRGFRIVEQAQLPGRTYRSSVLSKALAQPAVTQRRWRPTPQALSCGASA